MVSVQLARGTGEEMHQTGGVWKEEVQGDLESVGEARAYGWGQVVAR